jgi:hypothetical protein
LERKNIQKCRIQSIWSIIFLQNISDNLKKWRDMLVAFQSYKIKFFPPSIFDLSIINECKTKYWSYFFLFHFHSHHYSYMHELVMIFYYFMDLIQLKVTPPIRIDMDWLAFILQIWSCKMLKCSSIQIKL